MTKAVKQTFLFMIRIRRKQALRIKAPVASTKSCASVRANGRSRRAEQEYASENE
jgi:hypothetical protein